MGQCPEWQRGRAVNPLALAFVGSSPTWPTNAHVAQQAEHILGKNEVMSSSLIVGSQISWSDIVVTKVIRSPLFHLK